LPYISILKREKIILDLDLDPNPGLFFSLLSIEMYGKLPILELNRIAQKLWVNTCEIFCAFWD